MPSIISQLESILFLATKPLARKSLLKVLHGNTEQLEQAITELKIRYEHNPEDSGLRLLDHDDAIQITTAPENSDIIEEMYNTEITGELTKPALETLTIIAYRGPINKPELELIRGVNCSLILRNLMMRGLIVERKQEKEMLPSYAVTPEFLQFLGMTSVKDLPEYEELSSHQLLEELLKQRTSE